MPANDAVRVNSGYSKKLTWVRADNFVEAKVEYYDLAGRLLEDADGIASRAGGAAEGAMVRAVSGR